MSKKSGNGNGAKFTGKPAAKDNKTPVSCPLGEFLGNMKLTNGHFTFRPSVMRAMITRAEKRAQDPAKLTVKDESKDQPDTKSKGLGDLALAAKLEELLAANKANNVTIPELVNRLKRIETEQTIS